jgi:hypothetical protein
MCKKTDDRWSRWNNLIIEGKNIIVVQEFDEMLKNKEKITIGDLIIRDQALEEMDVISLSPNALYNRKNGYDTKGRKSKA